MTEEDRAICYPEILLDFKIAISKSIRESFDLDIAFVPSGCTPLAKGRPRNQDYQHKPYIGIVVSGCDRDLIKFRLMSPINVSLRI